jgi:hypothetical protein
VRGLASNDRVADRRAHTAAVAQQGVRQSNGFERRLRELGKGLALVYSALRRELDGGIAKTSYRCDRAASRSLLILMRDARDGELTTE